MDYCIAVRVICLLASHLLKTAELIAADCSEWEACIRAIQRERKQRHVPGGV